jgi:hypothetical protein
MNNSCPEITWHGFTSRMSIAKQVFDGPPGDTVRRRSSFLLIPVGYPRQGFACVGLRRLQKTLFAGARGAPVGHQVEVLTLRLNRGEPHPLTAFDAGHIDGGLKARTGRRWSGCLQHGILEFPKRRRNAIQSDQQVRVHLCPIPDKIGTSFGKSPAQRLAFRGATGVRDRDDHQIHN